MKFFTITSKRQLSLLGVSLIIFAFVFSIAVSGAGSATIGVSASKKKLPIYAVGREENDKIVSISFDAAWGNEDTEILIEILEKYKVKATFFLVGDWVDKFPESVKALYDAGHEIMNHSNTHPHMNKLSREQMRQEIEACNSKIEAITGERPLLFRAPYGEYNDTLIEVTDSLGMYCIQWDVDSHDWKNPPSEQITARVTQRVIPGSIVLFHNAAVNTPASLPATIENLLEKGYTFTKISENIYRDGYTIDHTGRQQKTAPAVTTAQGTEPDDTAPTAAAE
ncbi:MAG: polysaccharide deacetylase family protein [Oscillospiraceae bacterium]|jgi:polysaccharide deacetylase family sporulation protein PdaB|nr:polysaccharide deacetylase family protein [Oscillospiraceae bacterium]